MRERLEELTSRLTDCMLADRRPLARRLDGLRRRLKQGKPIDRGLAQLEKTLEGSAARLAARRAARPQPEYPEALPVSGRRAAIAAAIEEHQVVIVAGETGSGKTTQLPKICLDLGRGCAGLIGHTQPRRLAARSVAARIAEELGEPLGRAVGYKVRFSDRTRPETHIKLMTDGILLAEVQGDPLLEQYDTLIIDEAHERSLNIDFLLGYLKRLLPQRPDLKLIITSATINTESFSRFFDDAPVVEVSGRTYPVEVRYRPLARASRHPSTAVADPHVVTGRTPSGRLDVAETTPAPPSSPCAPPQRHLDALATNGGGKREPVTEDEEARDRDLPEAVVEAVDEVGRIDPRGDVLVFLPGEREIREVAEHLRKHKLPHTEVLPLYSRLSAAEQDRVFSSHTGRRVVLSTNVAETSLTVPGIRYVVDPGLVRLSRYSPRTKVQRLPIEPVSQASANQRAGRCGRVAAGVCIRLYAEEDFLGRPEYTDPEIRRTNLASVILQMAVMGLGEVEHFPFLTPPDRRQVTDGYKLLHELGAVDAHHRLTALGKRLARLPADPRLARMLLAAEREGCVREILVLTAALSIQDPRERPHEAQAEADSAHARFHDERSDFVALLKLWTWYHEQARHLSNSKLRRTCRDNFLSYVRMREWHDIHGQLHAVSGELGLKENPEPADYAPLHRALLTGLLGQVATLAEPAAEAKRGRERAPRYLGARNIKLDIFPGSALAKRRPKWLVASELVETSRLFARTVAAIEPQWLEPLAGHLIKRSHSEPHWEKRRGEVVAYESVTLYGLPIVTRRRVPFGTIDPATAREIFIRDGLVAGELREAPPFLAHNRELLAELDTLEAKSRRRDVVADEEVMVAFYDERLPAEVFDARRLARWRKETERNDPRLLFFDREALMQHGAEGVTGEEFPDHWRGAGLALALEYRFEPNHPADGVTAVVPLAALGQLAPEPFEWLVPGLLKEKLIALIKSLPKPLRKNFVPAVNFAEACLEALVPDARPLTEAFAARLHRLTGIEVPPEAWGEELPVHLQMNFRIVDEKGRALGEGRDLPALQARYAQQARAALAGRGGAEPSPWERTGLREWDFGDLPEEITVSRGGVEIRAWPGLADTGEAVDLRLFESPEAAEAATAAGARRLFLLQVADKVKYLRRNLPGVDRSCLLYARIGKCDELKRDVIDAAAERALLAGEPPPRSAAAFAERLVAGRNAIVATANELSELVRATLEAHHALQRHLKGGIAPHRLEAVGDVRDQVAALIAPGFVAATPRRWLARLPRYLEAARIRLEKLDRSPERDRAQMREVQALWRRWHERAEASAARGRPLGPEWVEFRWLIEELRVSLFAQEIGTVERVSSARLEKRWRELTGG